MHYTTHMEKDIILLKKSQKGDIDAFSELYSLLYKPVFQFVLKKTEGDVSLAEDIVSETFFKMSQKLDQFSSYEKPVIAWVYTIAFNELRMYWRKKDRYYFEALEKYPELRSDQKNSIDHIVDRERRDFVESAMKQLSFKEYAVLRDHYFTDLSIRHIAEKNKEKENTIKTRLHRARKKLRKILLQMKPIQEKMH